MDPLLHKLPALRSQTKRGTWKHSLGLCVVPLASLLRVLAQDSTAPALAVLSSLVCFLSWVLEQSPLQQQACSDPLALPLPQGPKTLRTIPPAFKEAVSREAAMGKLGKSPKAVLRTIRRMQHGSHEARPEPNSNRWHNLLARQHLQASQSTFAPDHRVLSLASDATRFGGLETLWTVVYSPELQMGAWCLPQVQPL